MGTEETLNAVHPLISAMGAEKEIGQFFFFSFSSASSVTGFCLLFSPGNSWVLAGTGSCILPGTGLLCSEASHGPGTGPGHQVTLWLIVLSV